MVRRRRWTNTLPTAATIANRQTTGGVSVSVMLRTPSKELWRLGRPPRFQEWLKEKDPTRAELVGIKTANGILLVLEKKDLGSYGFKEAQEVAKEFKAEGFGEFRCPLRHEVVDIQTAIDEGLHTLWNAIGGDSLIGDWFWTCEAFKEDGWFARRYSAYGAYFFHGTAGLLYANSVSYAFRCQAVTLYRLD